MIRDDRFARRKSARPKAGFSFLFWHRAVPLFAIRLQGPKCRQKVLEKEEIKGKNALKKAPTVGPLPGTVNLQILHHGGHQHKVVGKGAAPCVHGMGREGAPGARRIWGALGGPYAEGDEDTRRDT